MMVAAVTEISTECRLHLFLWPLFSLSGYSALLLFVYQIVEKDSINLLMVVETVQNMCI